MDEQELTLIKPTYLSKYDLHTGLAMLPVPNETMPELAKKTLEQFFEELKKQRIEDCDIQLYDNMYAPCWHIRFIRNNKTLYAKIPYCVGVPKKFVKEFVNELKQVTEGM